MDLNVLKRNGDSSGNKVNLPKHVFEIEPSEHAIYLAVKVQNANSRQGTASTKTRSMVRGGGRKPFKQKGRGAARAGTNRSPIWVGGGRIFGPEPRDYTQKLPQKVKNLARLSVFSGKAADNQVKLIEDFTLEKPKTKEMVSILQSLGLENQKTLLLLSEYDQSILRAGKNIPNLRIRVATTASTYDLMDCQCLLIQEGAVEKLSGAFKK